MEELNQYHDKTAFHDIRELFTTVPERLSKNSPKKVAEDIREEMKAIIDEGMKQFQMTILPKLMTARSSGAPHLMPLPKDLAEIEPNKLRLLWEYSTHNIAQKTHNAIRNLVETDPITSLEHEPISDGIKKAFEEVPSEQFLPFGLFEEEAHLNK